MFNTDFKLLEGSSDEGYILHHGLNIILREYGMKSMMNPFRYLMFWDKSLNEAKCKASEIRQMLLNILNEYRATHSREETEADPGILAHLVLNQYPSDVERIADMLIFLIAGHDTTGYTLAFTILEVARNPEVARKLKLEIDAIIPTDCKHIDANQLSQLQYLDCVIKESMRLWPVGAIGAGRRANQDLEYKGFLIPKGSYMVECFFSIFRTGINVSTRNLLIY
jgi:cytochrome P450